MTANDLTGERARTGRCGVVGIRMIVASHREKEQAGAAAAQRDRAP